MTDWQPHARSLAAKLVRSGALAGDWRKAFEQTPRHVFVPSFYAPGGTHIGADNADDPAAFMTAVYADESLTTQLSSVPGTDLNWPTSSSTLPSLMAQMLALLDVRDGHRVLEIGTGTGYNAALLCHRLGDDHVSSIDIDKNLVEAARTRLASLGYRPHLATGDGAGGIPERAPFDRIIATCGVPAIPTAWIRQLTDQGLIVVDLRGELGSSLITAKKVQRHAVQGRFLDLPGHFMWMRALADNPLHFGGDLSAAYDFTNPTMQTSDVPREAFEDRDFLFILQLAVPCLGPIGRTIRDGHDGIFIVGESDPSWVEISADASGKDVVNYGGPRLLWPHIAESWQRFLTWQRPDRRRLGLTAYDDGRHHIWLDNDSSVLLTLPSMPIAE